MTPIERLHLESLSNGLGGQSMYLLIMAIRKEIPATVSITADTGWENDCLWSTGVRTTAKEYFDKVVTPLCAGTHVKAYFVQSVDRFKKELPKLRDYIKSVAESGNFKNLNIPMFGSKGGRVMQRCTDKMKIRACRQQARRLGATTNRNAQGIHYKEADRRVNGIYLGEIDGWNTYQTAIRTKTGWHTIKWQTHYYPLVEKRMTREHVVEELKKEGIPYLISSECDGCPHKDLPRWERTSPETLTELAEIEAMFKGEFFFTEKRIPLMDAIQSMREKRDTNPKEYQEEIDFGCKNDICGI